MLQKQTLTIPLGLGVNTKADEKLVEQGAFNLVCENATFQKLGSVRKRKSYKSLSTDYYAKSDAAGTAAGNYSTLSYPPTCAATLGKSVLLRNKIGEYFYYHDEKFIKNDDNVLPEVKVKTIATYSCPTTIDHTDTDYDSYENIILAAAREGNQGGSIAGTTDNAAALILYSLDTETKIVTEKIENTAFSSTFGYARCGYTRVAGESYYYNIAVNSSSELIIKIFNRYGQENATSFTITGVRTPSIPNDGGIAVCRAEDDSTLFIVVNTTTSNQGKFIALSGTSKIYETTFAMSSPFYDSMSGKVNGGLVHVLLSNNKIIFNPDGTVQTSEAAVTGLSASMVAYSQDSVDEIIGYSSGSSIFFDTGSQNTENENTLLISDKVTIGGIEVFLGRGTFGTSNSEGTYFLMGLAKGTGRSGQKACARIAEANAITDSTDYYLNQPARFAKISGTKCAIAIPVRISPVAYVMNLVMFEVNQDYTSNSRATLGKNLYISGGYLAEFDGVSLVENGFHTPPSAPVLDVSSGSALTGTYTYYLVAKHIDGNGQVTRSAPSASTSTGAITSKSPAISVSSTPFGQRYKDCSIEIYRNTNGGTVFYYVAEVKVDMYSGSLISLYTDSNSDSTITDNALLYTSGNILENNPGPSGTAVCQGGNRVFVGGLPDEYEIAYSKKKLFGETVAFSDFFRLRFDSAQFNTSGGVKALGYMDDKLIAFKDNSIFYVTGDGPNETGLGEFTNPEIISSETGCSEPRSVVLTPLGLMFKGKKGIYLLNRGLATQYIGSGVEEFNDYNVVSACHVDSRNEVIFSISSSDTNKKYKLVYDYYSQQWSVNTGIRASDADVLNSEHIALDSSDNIPKTQTGSDFLDDSAVISTRVKTPWIKLSGLQDFGRIWTATILGKYKSSHTLNVKVYYDYDSSYMEEFNITPLISDPQYQYRIHLKKQKCESVQFEIQDTSQTGESMELTAITLEVGLRKGSYKINPGRKY